MGDSQQRTVEEDIARASAAQAYSSLVGAAVQALASGHAETFKSLFSPNFKATLDDAIIDGVIEQQLIPFFSDADHPGSSTFITDNQDQFGSTGFAFYTSIVTKGGEEKPFVIYMVEENGSLYVANLLVNTTFEEMHEGRSPADYA